MFWYDEAVSQPITEPLANPPTFGTVFVRLVARAPFRNTVWVYLIAGTSEEQSTSKLAMTEALLVSTTGASAVRVHVIVVGVGGGLPPPPLGSQVSPHWNLGPMPLVAPAGGWALTVVVIVWPPGGVPLVAAWAGRALAVVMSSPLAATATAMAGPAIALLMRDIEASLVSGSPLAPSPEPRGSPDTLGRHTKTALKRR
jgi:hypothetical protein